MITNVRFNLSDIVMRKDGQEFRSGCCADPEAVVISVDPFICVSEGGDMKWSRLNEEEVYFTGRQATPAQMKVYNRRLA